MKTWPDTDRAVVARYLGQLRLRHPISPTNYRQALHSFQEIVVRTQCPPSQVSRDALEAWLSERAMHWSGSTLLNRARIVNRFLDFLVQEGLVASNPVAGLRAEYCVNSSKAILRALLTPDPEQALAALRQFPPFGSVLGDLMRNHIALMRTRGFRYETQARWLWRFDRFVQAHPELAGEPLPVMLQHWAPESCRWPKASQQHFANTWKRGGALERRRVLSRACSGMTRMEHATRPRRSCGCSSTYCDEPALNHHAARRGLAFMTCVTRSW